MHRIRAAFVALAAALFIKTVSSAEVPTLRLERTIALGDVKGRIDHLAVDADRQRLFVAELGNDTVGVIDLKSQQVSRRLADLDEPQGLGYLRQTDTLYVANGGDGSLRLFSGDDLKPTGTVKLKGDADNIRIDQAHAVVFVGYGNGAVATFDGKTGQRKSDIPLSGHPESFQVSASSNRIYVNVPDAREIAIADGRSARVDHTLATGDARSNYPMALDEEAGRLLVVFRSPPVLRTLTLETERFRDVEICRDSDDVFVDSKRERVYVVCGQGVIDVMNNQGERIERVVTSSGARTGLFVPGLDRLFIAAPARGAAKASILVFRPADPIASH